MERADRKTRLVTRAALTEESPFTDMHSSNGQKGLTSNPKKIRTAGDDAEPARLPQRLPAGDACAGWRRP